MLLRDTLMPVKISKLQISTELFAFSENKTALTTTCVAASGTTLASKSCNSFLVSSPGAVRMVLSTAWSVVQFILEFCHVTFRVAPFEHVMLNAAATLRTCQMPLSSS